MVTGPGACCYSGEVLNWDTPETLNTQGRVTLEFMKVAGLKAQGDSALFCLDRETKDSFASIADENWEFKVPGLGEMEVRGFCVGALNKVTLALSTLAAATMMLSA